MIEIIESVWREVMTPSQPKESPYTFILIQIGHCMLGAALSVIFPGAWWFVIPPLYYAIKELPDLMNGGSLGDGIIDTMFIALGAMYIILYPWWPLIVLATVGAMTLIVYAKKGIADANS